MAKNKILQAAVFLAFLAGLVLIRHSGSATVSLQPIGQRKNAAAFTLPDADAHDVTLAGYRGKVVLLNFWATWCGPCQEEIPWFIDFENNYRDRGFTVLGVSLDEDGWKAVRPYIQNSRMNYPVMLASRTVAASYGGIEGIPTTLLIDRSGKIAARYLGVPDKANYQKNILQLLGEPLAR
jgi:peroxiredoxin